MERFLEWLTAPLSRTFKFVAMPVMALVLVVIFVFLGFPYEVLADRIVRSAELQTGATIRYASIAPRITVGGPGFRFREVDVITPSGKRYSADPVSVRPAWSLGWLTGRPAVRADLKSEHGQLAGVATVGRSLGWSGDIRDLDLSLLPIRVGSDVDLEGRADIRADIALNDGRPEGEIEFEARDGELSHSAIPIPIEFDTGEGRLTLGGERLVRVEVLKLEGPLVAVQLSGEIGLSDQPGREPIDASLDLTVREAGLQQMARNLGLELDAQGHARLEIGGTLSAPAIE